MAMGYTALTHFDIRVTLEQLHQQIKHSETEFAVDEIITTSILDN